MSKLSVLLVGLSAVQAMAEDASLHGFLNPNDPVAISFWIISISMVAATVFFLWESMSLGHQWKTSMNVGALGTSPILYRYIDWSITVPLQMVEFYFILSAVND